MGWNEINVSLLFRVLKYHTDCYVKNGFEVFKKKYSPCKNNGSLEESVSSKDSEQWVWEIFWVKNGSIYWQTDNRMTGRKALGWNLGFSHWVNEVTFNEM